MWIVAGLISAISDAAKNILAKHNIKSFDSAVISWAWVAYSLILVLPIMFIGGVPSLDGIFWIALIARVFLDLIAIILYIKAIKYTDLSLSLPILALTPLFVLFVGMAINHDMPSSLGLIGIGAIISGTYLLNFKRGEKIYQPALAIYRNKGIFTMLWVAILWGVTGALHRLAILHSNPYFYTGLSTLILAIIFTPVALWSSRKDFIRALKIRELPKIIPIGLLSGLTTLAQMIGQSLTLSVYIVSIKRASILFSSILAYYFFKEPIKKRLIPICLIIVGVVLISLC